MELIFDGDVIEWRGPAPFVFVRVPPEESSEIQAVSRELTYGWGCIPVSVRLGGSEWTTALMPKDGAYLVPLRKAFREAERVDVGDVVPVALTLGG
ncbi:hypothetical protein GCM10012320_07170 [Sinomonas cellulolyticus]|uniref:DUF1905 domain-containing protein n=1 Tax=Sinomonas cellulolyticus TaxID=2801916 RepID=A0ABS1K3E8_9MICC|nr:MULTISPECIES: DUF1905 domain-containing protein [Sinomonas]MBL0706044.1 DUF1905 domain-containing protein [Sinomonas cellulolyticus]GHG43200.1 hypothetical protein GCM10012320_07170 [Sinomonas sp. KCTC 49339]